VRACELPQPYLGYRVTRQGFDLGKKAEKRLRRRLPSLARGPALGLFRSLVAWRGAARF
jgi:hypothetical protein